MIKCSYFEKCKGQGNTVIGRVTHKKTIYCPWFRKEELVLSADENEEVLPRTSGTSIYHPRNKSNVSGSVTHRSDKNITRSSRTNYNDDSNRTKTIFRSNDNLSDDNYDDDVYSVHQTRNKSNVSGISTRMSDKNIESSYQVSLDNINNNAFSSSTSNITASILRSDDYDVDDSNESDKSINVQEQM
jgi:hypothetical protein